MLVRVFSKFQTMSTLDFQSRSRLMKFWKRHPLIGSIFSIMSKRSTCSIEIWTFLRLGSLFLNNDVITAPKFYSSRRKLAFYKILRSKLLKHSRSLIEFKTLLLPPILTINMVQKWKDLNYPWFAIMYPHFTHWTRPWRWIKRFFLSTI